MKRVMVCSRTFGFGSNENELIKLFERYGLKAQFSSLEEAGDDLGKVEGIILGTNPFTRKWFNRASKLRAICKYGVGTDNIDKKAASEYGVEVLNLPGVNCDAVAELALGLMFSVARRISEGDRGMRAMKWERLLGVSIREKALGLIGAGAIGMTLARMVSGLDMKILAYDIVRNNDISLYGGEYVELDALLRHSDFISLHVPLASDTYHLLGDREFNIMKKTAIVVNTSRGAILDEEALYRALKDKRIGGAGLDVFEKEPPFGRSKILEMEKIVCTPHIAAYNWETLRRMDEASVSELRKVLRGGNESP